MVLAWWNLDQVTNRPLLELDSWIPGEFQRTSWRAVPGRGLVDLSAWKTPKLMNRKGNMTMNISYAKVQCRLLISIRLCPLPDKKICSNWFLCLKKTIEFDNFGPFLLWLSQVRAGMMRRAGRGTPVVASRYRWSVIHWYEHNNTEA